MTLEEKVIVYLDIQKLSVEEKKDTEYLEDLLDRTISKKISEYLEDLLECFESEIEIDKEYYMELFQKKYLNI